jgi:hypothetical protein
MSYGYDAPYDDYSQIEYAQPHADPYFVSPDSPAAQLGLNQERIRELLEEQEQLDREFQQELEEDRLYKARVSTEYQEQDHEARWVPTPPISNSDPTPQAYEVPDEPPENATSSYDDGPLDPELAPRVLHQPPTPIPDGADPTPQPEYSGYDTANQYDEHVVLLDGCEPNDGANAEPGRDNAFERLVHELVVSDDAIGDWAEEMEGISLTQGEYILPNHSAPPALPPSAPQHQPPPPITIYMPPRINYAPPPARHRPPRTRNTSQRPPLRPYTRPQRVRRPPRENRTGHVTATQRDGFRATTRVKRDGPPLYIPPALRGDGETTYESQRRVPWSQDVRRDPPPHKDLSTRGRKRSDSPNWRAPSPDRPASFRSHSPPPQSPPTPPICPPCPHIPSSPQKKNLTGSQLTSDLISLIKTTSEALQSIVRIAERLMHQANAGRRVAHKSQRTAWSSREDACGNVACPQPPMFPSGRGVPVTGSLGGSEVLA